MTDKEQLEKWRINSKKYRETHSELTRRKCREYKLSHPSIVLKAHLKYLVKISILTEKRTPEYRRAITAWSRVIKKRDKLCVICGSNSELEAHHIIHKHISPKLSFNINNGITLCKKHHYQVHGKMLK